MSQASAVRGGRSLQFNLGSISGIPAGEGRTFRAAGHDIAVFRGRGGSVYATSAWCPHLGGPLADGLIGDGQVICPLHGFTFDLRSGRPHGNPCDGLHVFQAVVTPDGDIVVTINV
jgi:nitrite reductase (NADH) small subunit